MHDRTDEPTAHGDQFAAHLGRRIRRALIGLALIAAPLALLRTGLFTGPGWVGALWICQGLGLPLLIVTCYRMVLGPVGQRLSTPTRPQVPLSSEVRAHQRRMDSGQGPGPR
ncbi:hypothetical protein [Streptomyces sp. NPDC006785]|uniref:hypothetical protein n=1 Tax=Streptomyces sp. NPDC006785 TaxID=3155461 RepID=UPI0033F5C234